MILYGLLTGSKPYDLGSHSMREIERIVCEVTPTPPSQLVRASRGQRLPGDLDKIVLMAMRKEPDRRYASAHELAEDVRRCLAHRPVLAHRDTLKYRVSSFVRRNVVAVIVAAAFAALVLGGAIAVTWQWRRAVAEQSRAETQQHLAEQTLAFLVDLFRTTDSQVPAGEVSARVVLGRGVARLHDGALQSAHARAALQHTLGVIYRNIGDYVSAATMLTEAIAVRSAGSDTQLALADSLFQLGAIDADMGKPDHAVSLLRRALSIRMRVLGADHLLVADTLEELAYNANYKVPQDEAEDYMLRALEIRRHHPGDRQQLSASLASLAQQYSRTGRHSEADALVHEAMAYRRSGSPGGACEPGDEEFFNNVALLRYREGYFDDAERTFGRALECLRRVRGPDHPEVVDLTATYVTIWREQGRYAQAEERARQVLPLRMKLYGDDSPAADNALHHLALVLYERNKLAEAEQMETAAKTLREKRYKRRHRLVAESIAVLGDIHLARGDPAAAEAAYRDALEIWRQTNNEAPPEVAKAMRGLAEAQLAQNQLGAAKSSVESALALQRGHLRATHPAIASTLTVLGEIVLASSPVEAETVVRHALDIRRAAFAPDHPYIARTESLLGVCLLRQDKRTEALPLLQRSVAILRAQLGDDHPETRRAVDRLRAAELPIAPR